MSREPQLALPLSGPDRAPRVRDMFARIVPRYDLMNTLMSGGQDRQWRRLTAAAAQPTGAFALDLATGTGELALELLRQGARRVVAADYCEPMLVAARAKLKTQGEPAIQLVAADALDLPFGDASFDCVTSGFLLRNAADLPRCLAEMRRVLRPGGRAVALEITHMTDGPVAQLFNTYFRRVVPLIGSVVTGDSSAYRYLPASLAAFPRADRLVEMFRQAGFDTVGYRRAGFGSIAIHVAQVAA